MITLVLDTETLGLDKPIVYDLGYVIYDTADGKVLKEKDYIIKQVYDNKELFESAYYKSKRPFYESKLDGKQASKVYWGNACRYLMQDIQKYKPDGIYAFNSRFDFNAINKTCEMFESKINPTADGIKDIMNEIDNITSTEDYKEFCRRNGYLTKHKKPQCRRTAEVLYRYLTNQTEFIEEHMALGDSQIELYILMVALGYILV